MEMYNTQSLFKANIIYDSEEDIDAKKFSEFFFFISVV